MLSSLLINDAGFAKQAEVILSPNFDNRPNKSNINLIVIHNISLPPGIYGGNNI
ncbi:MAG: 1,6-anhydro-N-acetylmuramyl-L-alanine amidase AmpD, partial [Pseudomonadota bacterium]